jgi:hypothetical protein
MKETTQLLREVDKLRGKACHKVLQAAAADDKWRMRRYAAINIYLAELQDERRKITW